MDGVQNLLCELRSHAARMHANRMANSINQPAVHQGSKAVGLESTSRHAPNNFSVKKWEFFYFYIF